MVFDLSKVPKKMKRILYLIPLDGTGGVEVAAQTLKDLDEKNFKLEVKYIFQKKSEIFNILKILESFKKVFEYNPEILIVSLWRAALVGILIKLFRPRVKIVLFVHSEKDTHFFDYIITRITLFFSKEVWFDSDASSTNRFKFLFKKIKKHILSFNLRNIDIKEIGRKTNEPNFIYWGRISNDKGLYRALEIFEGVLKYFPNATYKIIGSHQFDYHQIKQYCVDRNLMESVKFFDEMNFDDIKDQAKFASFYLQTSKFEGFAMSVVESMMMGLVPIVTPVGEIGKYCNSKNSITVYSNMEAVRDIVMVLRNNIIFNKISSLAVKTWGDQISYKESVINNCKRLVNEN